MLLPFVNFGAASLATPIQWGNLLILGAIHTCLTYILMYSAYQKLPTTTIAVMTFIYPVVAIFVDYFFYGVVLNTYQMIGVFLILFSSFAVSQDIQFRLRRRAA